VNNIDPDSSNRLCESPRRCYHKAESLGLRSQPPQGQFSSWLKESRADATAISCSQIVGELTASLANEVNQPIAARVTGANTCLRLTRDQPDLEEARGCVENG
jgi:C4-dicarboxylate-specific signal transduction histidine kinase